MSGFLRSAKSVLFSTMLLSASARATTLRALSTEDLVQNASAIAVTQVMETHTIRRGGRLTTLVTLEVVSPLKGLQSGQQIYVRIPGGEEGEWAQRVEGAPVMHPGDMNVVFLEPSGPSAFQVVGLEQGKLDIVRDPSKADGWLVQRASTAPRVVTDKEGRLQEVPPLPLTEPLGPYLDRVHALMEEHP